MSEEEIEILEKYKDPLVKKLVDFYKDAFYVSPIKKLRIAQLEVIEIAIEDARKLKGLKRSLAEIGDDPTESEKEMVSLTLFGNKEIFDQAMKFVEKVPVMIAGLQASEEASEITTHRPEEIKIRRKTTMPKGIAT